MPPPLQSQQITHEPQSAPWRKRISWDVKNWLSSSRTQGLLESTHGPSIQFLLNFHSGSDAKVWCLHPNPIEVLGVFRWVHRKTSWSRIGPNPSCAIVIREWVPNERIYNLWKGLSFGICVPIKSTSLSRGDKVAPWDNAWGSHDPHRHCCHVRLGNFPRGLDLQSKVKDGEDSAPRETSGFLNREFFFIPL